MNLLLTSAGLMNQTIINKVIELSRKPINIAFIPTAANAEVGDKAWLIKDLVACQKLGEIDIIDIAAMPKEMWLPRLEKATTIVVGGGNTGYLMEHISKSGLQQELPKLLKTRLYVGISAGSIVTARSLWVSSEFLYGDEVGNPPKGLGYVDFHVRPHLGSPYFPRLTKENLETLAPKLDGDMYALDDQSAVLYVDGNVEVISEGTWHQYKKPN